MFEAMVAYLVAGSVFAAIIMFQSFRDGLFHLDDWFETIFALLVLTPLTIALWPVFTFTLLRSKYIEKKSRDRWYQTVNWDELKTRWHEVATCSEKLDEALSSMITDEGLSAEHADQIKVLITKLDDAYARWHSLKDSEVFRSQYVYEDQNQVFREYLSTGIGWPRVRKSIFIEQDPAADANRVSRLTISGIFEADLPSSTIGSPGRFMERPAFRAPSRGVPTEKSPWQLSISGAFRSSVKKLRGQEKEKLEHALEEILIAPATALGNTKTPLSNNLKDFWRYRLGDWRIIYTIDLPSKTVTLLDYTHRSKAYH